MAKKKTIDFEQSLEKLESIVEKMELGELSLEESLNAFEEGMGIADECQKVLSSAEQRMEKITKKLKSESAKNE